MNESHHHPAAASEGPLPISLLDRHLAGQATAAEATAVARWLTDPDHRRIVERLRDVRPGQMQASRTPDVDAAVERLMVRGPDAVTRVARPAVGSALRSASPKHALRRWIVATSVAVAAVAAVMTIASRRIERAPTDGPQSVKQYVTAMGQRASIVLTDGTRIILGAGSRLAIPADYGRTQRAVLLEGQAQFTVRYDARLPFVVRASGTTVRDLGTVFVVSAYPPAERTTVAVADGRVSVRTDAIAVSNAATLERGSVATIATDGSVQVNSNADLRPYVSWTRGTLVFEETPVPEALAQLARWYDVQFEFTAATLGGGHLTATFEGNTLTARDLDDLAVSLGVRAVRSGRTIKLYARRS